MARVCFWRRHAVTLVTRSTTRHVHLTVLSCGESRHASWPDEHRGRGQDLGDQWSHYCILGLEGETLAEGQLRTTQQHITEFFQAWNAARVVFEVGTHSAWVQEVICGCGHEVLVANPRLMEGWKRRKRKNDQIDANKLARLGRVDPQSWWLRQVGKWLTIPPPKISVSLDLG